MGVGSSDTSAWRIYCVVRHIIQEGIGGPGAKTATRKGGDVSEDGASCEVIRNKGPGGGRIDRTEDGVYWYDSVDDNPDDIEPGKPSAGPTYGGGAMGRVPRKYIGTNELGRRIHNERCQNGKNGHRTDSLH
jgi:hypothetical protein